jgi:hypothetical protein
MIYKKYIHMVLFIAIVFFSTSSQPMSAAVSILNDLAARFKGEQQQQYIAPVVTIGDYQGSKSVLGLCQWLSGTVPHCWFNRCMFSEAPYEVVSSFVHQLAKEVECPLIIDFDFRGDFRTLDQRGKAAIQQAIDSYNQTGKPSIIYIHHTGIPTNDREDFLALGFFQNCEELAGEDNRSFVLVYAIEDSCTRLCRDIRNRVGNYLRIEGNLVYDERDGSLVGKKKIQETSHLMNSIIIGSVVTGIVAGFFLATYLIILKDETDEQ